ncbi:MAG TPA: MmcQ/YjbR family DNA-binding protein [Candidatus Baltobacteraceae bacterium]|nr:MmcQ/YjbR family DNA-binding protein [Candidatus Baltobacteraceae bacterium]
MPKPSAKWVKLRARALRCAEAYEDFPWGDRVAKVDKKIFAFLGDGEGEDPRVALKLLASHERAQGVSGARAVGYGLGRAGWLSIPIGGSGPPLALLLEWIDESYRLVAPKRLLRDAPTRSARKAPQRKKG